MGKEHRYPLILDSEGAGGKSFPGSEILLAISFSTSQQYLRAPTHFSPQFRNVPIYFEKQSDKIMSNHAI